MSCREATGPGIYCTDVQYRTVPAGASPGFPAFYDAEEANARTGKTARSSA
jgi:hypothetical protein